MTQNPQSTAQKLNALRHARVRLLVWDNNIKRKLWDLAGICKDLKPFLETGETGWPEVRILYDQVVEKYRLHGGDPELLKDRGWDAWVGFEKDGRFHTNRLIGFPTGMFFAS